MKKKEVNAIYLKLEHNTRKYNTKVVEEKNKKKLKIEKEEE